MTEPRAGLAHTPVPATALRMQLCDVINHELRTPLTTLIGHAELLQEADLPEPARSSLSAIVRAAERLRELAAKVTALGEAELLVGHVVPTPCDLAAVGRDVVSECAEPARRRQVTVRMTELAGSVLATVDVWEVRQAVSALVRHAVGRAPAGSAVEVEVGVHGDRVTVGVRDSGAGLPLPLGPGPGMAYREAAADLVCGRDSGLELALAEAVASAHGGELVLSWDESCTLCVRLELPRQATLAA